MSKTMTPAPCSPRFCRESAFQSTRISTWWPGTRVSRSDYVEKQKTKSATSMLRWSTTRTNHYHDEYEIERIMGRHMALRVQREMC